MIKSNLCTKSIYVGKY